MRNQSSGGTPRKRSLFVLALVFMAGALFTGLMNVGIAFTNQEAFCTNCHSMKINLEELKETVHYSNRTGVRATCSDCHVPKEFGPKMWAKIMAAKDVYHELMGTVDTKEKYEERRWHMANLVWDKMKANNSRECRSCHDYSQMNLSVQTRSARNRHSRAVDEGQTCIDCHKGIAHTEPDEPDTSDKAKKGAAKAAPDKDPAPKSETGSEPAK
jgi:cytochrome c-type protein NapC